MKKSDEKFDRRSGRSIIKTVGKCLLGFVVIGLFSAVICGSAILIYAVNYGKTVSSEAFSELARAQDRTTHLYYLTKDSTEGAEVAVELSDQALFSSQNREWAKLSEMPEDLKNM